MYLVDFFKRLSSRSNIPIMIYLVLNVFVIMFIFTVFTESSIIATAPLSIILYVISMLIALSPIGEWILRLQTGCKRIKRVEQLNKIEPLFKEVYEKAKKINSQIPDDVELFISEDSEPNAFATGRKTICITEGLLSMPEGQIKATLAHEFGHLAHKDTDLILLISVGNFIVTATMLGIRMVILIYNLIARFFAVCIDGSEDGLAAAMTSLGTFMATLFISGFMWLWTKLGVLLVMKSSRDNEYGADEFSFNLGYGNELCELLDAICGSHTKGLFANLASSHPDKHDRIAKLQALGATYRKDY